MQSLGILLALAAATPRLMADEPRLGFTPSQRPIEAKAEAAALAAINPASLRGLLRTLTAEPHVAGTPADYKTALFVRDKLRAWGWKADLVEYEVLLNYPRPATVQLELVRPEARALKVTEDPWPADKDSASPLAFPAFHGYGVSGDVTGQVVYANYGRPEDFEALEKLGIDVKGKIALTRYGEIFRGLKVRNAQKRGAIGILIASDPADDGYIRGDVYPNGPFRPASAVQRGSVQFLSLGPGDPTTPGTASVKGAKRLPFDKANGFTLSNIEEWERAAGQKREDAYPTIPSLPISPESARAILEQMGGPNVPGGWQGGLPLPYHVGPGPVEVRFSVGMDYDIRTIWNVIATIAGSAEPDRWVMLGNHRDAWTYGAVDPGSGTAATLETCRAIGEAVKAGWKPRRTLMYASWDGEEYGLVGSTEWAEQNAKEAQEKALLMLNVDVAVSGTELDGGGVPSLRDLFQEAAGDVIDPRTGRTLRANWLAAKRSQWAQNGPLELEKEPGEFRPQLDPLGSGSDYTAFVDHLGIPALDLGFKGKYGVYHSIYDNFFWMEKFGDPEFLTHATASRLYTLIIMRAAAADVAPLRFGPYASAISDHLDDLRRLSIRRARGTEGKSPPAIDKLADLRAALDEFRKEAESLDRATESLASRDDPPALTKLNDALGRVERAFLIPDGLPNRPWFRHAIYAPGVTTGYASWPLPGLRLALLSEDRTQIDRQTSALIERIRAATAAMGEARRAAEPAAANRR
ncbi:MAG: M28 family metallopeptidase [Isosphaeraceae bacterium]